MAKNNYLEYNNNCSKVISKVRSWNSILGWELALISDQFDSCINGPGTKLKCCMLRDATWGYSDDKIRRFLVLK